MISRKELEDRAYKEEAMRLAQQTDPYAIGVQVTPEQAMAMNQYMTTNMNPMVYGGQQTPNPVATQFGLQAQVRQPANQQNIAQMMADGVLSAMTGESEELRVPDERMALDTEAAQGFLEQLGRFEPR